MHNLFGDRFLRLFAGDLQLRLKRTIPNVIDQNPEAITAEPVDPASEERHEKNFTEGNQLLNEKEQNEKKNTERLSE
jgi:hypothetical protein